MSLFSNILGKNRKRQFKSLSAELGMEYSKTDEFKLIKKLKAFQLFRKGHSKRIRNLMIRDDGNLEVRYAIFDYHYTIQAGQTPVPIFQTVFFMDSKLLELPKFLIKPEHFFHRLGKYLNLVEDIEFEDHPEFSNKYLVQSEYPEMLKDMVSPEMMHFFSIENKWSLEGLNYYLIFYRNGKRLSVDTIKAFHEKGHDIVQWLLNKE